jgi:flagellar basal body-associated protein FliL
MHTVREAVYVGLRSKNYNDVSDPEGKPHLEEKLITMINEAIDWKEPVEVHFTKMVIK